MADVDIIIVNFNTRELLKKCIGSIHETTHETRYTITVIDNNSGDGSVEMLKDIFPAVRIVSNRDNVGFAKANNQGLVMGSGKYCLLLNSDTVVMRSAVDTMKKYMDNHRETGIIGSKIYYPDYSVQGTARTFPAPINSIFGRKSLITRWFPKNRISRKYLACLSDDHKEPFEVDWVSGACLMIRRAVIDDIGLLDEGFWMYWEDADWCYRAKKKGWKVFCVPQAEIIHYEGASSSKKSGKNIIAFHKSVYRYYRKHHLKSSFNPMNVIALAGLSVRAGILLVINYLKKT